MLSSETARLLQQYKAALEAGDFETMVQVFKAAETNTDLLQWIERYHAEIEGDPTEEEVAELKEIVKRELDKYKEK